MSNIRQSLMDYFISLTHCSRENAMEYLNKSDWKLDTALNLFFESNSEISKTNPLVAKPLESSDEKYDNKTSVRTVDLLRRLAGSTSSKPIIIPTVIEFQRLDRSSFFVSSHPVLFLRVDLCNHSNSIRSIF